MKKKYKDQNFLTIFREKVFLHFIPVIVSSLHFFKYNKIVLLSHMQLANETKLYLQFKLIFQMISAAALLYLVASTFAIPVSTDYYPNSLGMEEVELIAVLSELTTTDLKAASSVLMVETPLLLRPLPPVAWVPLPPSRPPTQL